MTWIYLVKSGGIIMILEFIILINLTGFKGKGGGTRLLDVLLYKLYACAAWSGIYREKVQRHAGNFVILFAYLIWFLPGFQH